MYININLLVNIYAPLHGLTHAETCVYLNRVHFAGRPISDCFLVQTAISSSRHWTTTTFLRFEFFAGKHSKCS